MGTDDGGRTVDFAKVCERNLRGVALAVMLAREGGEVWGHMTGSWRRAGAGQGMFWGREAGTSARVLTVKSMFAAI